MTAVKLVKNRQILYILWRQNQPISWIPWCGIWMKYDFKILPKHPEGWSSQQTGLDKVVDWADFKERSGVKFWSSGVKSV